MSIRMALQSSDLDELEDVEEAFDAVFSEHDASVLQMAHFIEVYRVLDRLRSSAEMD